jgi:hypothetical protein
MGSFQERKNEKTTMRSENPGRYPLEYPEPSVHPV